MNFEAVRSRMKLKPLVLPPVVVVSSVSKKSLFSLDLRCAIKVSDLVIKPIKAQRECSDRKAKQPLYVFLLVDFPHLQIE